jgi:tRNA A-37 threonylcarbamoyl transferase component Bud32/tetratricopeptide (TPR) repeat protein
MKSPDSESRPDPARVEELFHRAAELPGGEQAAFLARECGEEQRLLESVSSLLAASRESSTTWDRTALDLEARSSAIDSRPARPGEFFGPYRIVRRVAAGGMSVVYEALRDDAEFHKRVAIKFVQRGIDDGALGERFRGERQILAQLEHPYIARLLDGGTTADDLPYLVMEYVDGVPIDRFVTERRLTRTDRLHLFLQVCEAVQYAHRNLVVHRDLKPGNILVTAGGMPKLLDFGIAKLITSEPPGQATTVRALTPECASPEQVAGRSITTATDVYSLGVLLFVLLAERLPYGAGAAQPVELIRAICEEGPVWQPSGLIASELRSILAQALRKEPERRYLSVEQFDADVRRYLAGLPVAARADTWSYRARKFAVRRALPLAATAALTVVVLAGLTTSLWEARRAERQRLIAQRRFDDARRLAYTVIHEIQPKLAAINGTVALRKTLIEETLVYLESLGKDAADSPALMRELIDSYVALAGVAADAGTSNVGDPQRASQILQQAQALANTLQRADSANPASARCLVRFYVAEARQVISYGTQENARAFAARAMEIAERLAAAKPDRDSQIEVASAAMTLGNTLGSATDDSDEDRNRKIELFQRSLAIWRELLNLQPQNPDELRKRIALADKNLSSVWVSKGNYPKALEYAIEARDLDEVALARNPSSPAAQMDLAFDIGAIGWACFQMRDYPGAVEAMRQNVALREKVAAANADDRRATDRLAYALRDLAGAEELLGDRAAARRDLLRTASLYVRLAASGPLVPQSLGRFAFTAYEIGEMERKQGDGREGCQWLRKCVALMDEYERRTTVLAGTPEEIAQMRRAASSCPP